MDRIGRYKIEAEIGRGGFGRVYRAFDPTVGRCVAIKVLASEADKDLLTRFRNEASAAGTLKHRNIVTVHDYGELDGGTPYLVMEYLEGQDLHRTLLGGHKLSLADKISIMSQVADGLHHAHLNDIVHRDVKPANIMLLTDGSVKIMDFGIARLVRDRGARLTQHGNLIGTISYMAPEQFRGADVDALCDIFAYGVIYYELMTGGHPFNASDTASTIYSITSVNPPSIRESTADCPPLLDDLIAKCLSKERETRYQSFEDIQFDIAPLRLQVQTASAQALVKEAAVLVQNQHLDAAQQLIRTILHLDPSNKEARQLRETIQRQNQLKASKERARHIIETGRQELSAGRFTEAVDAFQSALRLDADSTEIRQLLEEAKTALAHAERAAALLTQARQELNGKHFTKAHQSILECLQHAPNSQEAQSLLIAIVSEIERRDRERRFKESLTKVNELIESEAYDQALNVLADLTESYPADLQIQELSAAAYAGKEESARRHRFARELENARQLMAAHRWKEAIIALEEIERAHPAEQEIRPLLAYCRDELRAQLKVAEIERLVSQVREHVDQHRFENAVSVLTRGLRTYPGDSTLEALLAKTTAARRVYERDLAIRTAESRTREQVEQDQFEEAINLLDDTIAIWNAPELMSLREEVDRRWHENRIAEAIATAIEEANNLLAAGRHHDAAALLRRVVSEHPSNPAVTELLSTADALIAQEKRARAIARTESEVRRLVRRSDFAGALRVLEQTLAEYPADTVIAATVENVKAARIRNRIESIHSLREEGRYSEGLEAIQAAINECGPAAFIEIRNATERDFKEQQEQQAITSILSAARQQYSSKELQQAIETLEVGSRSYPHATQLFEELAAYRHEAEEIRRARAIDGTIREATALLNGKEFARALKALRGRLTEFPDDPRLTVMISDAVTAQTEFNRAEGVRVALQRARELQAAGDPNGAARALDHALKTLPNEPQIINELSAVQRRISIERSLQEVQGLLEAGDFQAADSGARSARIAYPEEPRFAELHSRIEQAAAAVRRQAAVSEAVAAVRTILNTGDLEAADRRARLELNKYAGEPALVMIRQEVESSRDIKQRINAVEVLLRRGEPDSAVCLLEVALQRYPEDHTLQALIEKALDERKLKEDADRQIVNAIEDAQAMALESRFEVALSILTAATAQFGEDARIRSAVGQISKQQREHELKQQTLRAIQDSETAFAEDDPHRAIEIITAALQVAPGNAQLLELKRRSELRLKAQQSTAKERTPNVFNILRNWRHVRLVALAVCVTIVVMAVTSMVINKAAEPTERSRSPVVVDDTPPRPAAASILKFEAKPTTVSPGEQVQICYGVENVNSLRIQPPVAMLKPALNHCFNFAPTAAGDYTLIATGEDGAVIFRIIRLNIEGQRTPATGTLLVEAQQDDAVVIVNGRRYGEKTRKGVLRLALESREYTVAVEKPGFETPPPQRVKLEAGKSARLAFMLNPQQATVQIVGVLPGTTVTLDGAPLSGGIESLKINPGSHILDLARPGYVSRQIPFLVVAGQTVQLQGHLDAIPKVVEAPKTVEPPKPDPLVEAAQQWERLQNSRDASALEQFRRTHPGTPYADKAMRRIEQLEWETARAKRDKGLLQTFISRHPTSVYRDPALKLLDDIEWENVKRKEINSLRAFIQQFPNNPHVKEATSILQALEQSERDKAQIELLLRRYEEAYAKKDRNALVEIWPTMPRQVRDTLSEVFRAARISMKLSPKSELAISGDTGTLVCERVSITRFSGSDDLQQRESVTVRFRRSGQGWIIQSIE